jgi:processive 1,2-diacylglycerol beta-glucosyltransferase
MDKILLIYASFGEGHKRAACSLKNHLNAPCIDLLDFSYSFIRRLYLFLYLNVTEHLPWAWKLLYSSTKSKHLLFLVNKIQEFLFFHFFEYLRKTRPKVIISTHFFPLFFIDKIKNDLGIKVIAIVTDIRAHPIWANDCVDMYFVPHEETKNDLIKLNIKASKITSGYVALREGFLNLPPQENIRKNFSLDNRPVVLFMSSVRGNFLHVEEIISQIKDKFNIIFIYGKNFGLKKYLESINLPNVKFFPFYEKVWELFSISTVLVTKPGGLTAFEGIYTRKLFIFMRYIPGQEKENMDFMEKNGIGKFVKDTGEFMEALDYFNEKKKEFDSDYPVIFSDIRPAIDKTIDSFLSDTKK